MRFEKVVRRCFSCAERNEQAFSYVLGIGQLHAPADRTLPLRAAPPSSQMSRLSLQEDMFSSPRQQQRLLEQHQQQQLQQQEKPMQEEDRPHSPSSHSKFVSPRLVPPSALVSSVFLAPELPVSLVVNPLYSRDPAVLRAALLALVRLPCFPPRVMTAAHPARGGRGPPVGESALFEAPEDEYPPLSVDEPLQPPHHHQHQLIRAGSLSAGLSRMRDVLAPKAPKQPQSSQSKYHSDESPSHVPNEINLKCGKTTKKETKKKKK
jgi:hypothetical protein